MLRRYSFCRRLRQHQKFSAVCEFRSRRTQEWILHVLKNPLHLASCSSLQALPPRNHLGSASGCNVYPAPWPNRAILRLRMSEPDRVVLAEAKVANVPKDRRADGKTKPSRISPRPAEMQNNSTRSPGLLLRMLHA